MKNDMAGVIVSVEQCAKRILNLSDREYIDVYIEDGEEGVFGVCRLQLFDTDLIIASFYGGGNSSYLDITGVGNEDAYLFIKDWLDNFLKHNGAKSIRISFRKWFL